MGIYDKRRDLFAEDENGNPTSQRIATIAKAPVDMAQVIINRAVGDDTRSPWLWVRLANGDLMLGCFPCGDGYFETELDPNRP